LKSQLDSTQNELDSIKVELTSVKTELTKTKMELELAEGQLSAPAPTPAPTPTPIPPQTPAPLPSSTKVATIDIGWPMGANWDADADIDGIELYLTPKDSKGERVDTEGVISAKLWLERSLLEGGGKGNLIQEWGDIQVKKDDYDWIGGATVHLEYKGFKPEQLQLGTLEVTLVTPDDESFSARATSIFLGE
jgi:hypothetical protein